MYITYFKTKKHQEVQFSIKDLFEQSINIPDFIPNRDPIETITFCKDTPHPKYYEQAFISMTVGMDELHRQLTKFKTLPEPLYTEFQIPKKSGGMRTIHAPSKELKLLQKQAVFVFQNYFRILYHDSAFAYI